MKLFVYSYRTFDEAFFFEKFSKEYGIELGICREAPTLQNAYLAKGYDYISVITTPIDEALVTAFHQYGIKMISTRTVGYDHIDLKKAKELGVRVSNVTYTPESVADYTVMLMLMSIRRMKHIMQRAAINDFSLEGLAGRTLSSFTIGIIGTGKIGTAVIKVLNGFGCKIYAYDTCEKEEIKEYVSYADLETVYKRCDMISLHMDLNQDNYHLINKESIKKMRDGVILINTARGGLIDSESLIEGLEQGKIGAVGLDVVEKEFGLYYYNLKNDTINNRELFILRSFQNVIVTPHMAFYTDQSISDMVKHSILACYYDARGKENPWCIL